MLYQADMKLIHIEEKYKNDEELEHDEKLSPMFEDIILLNVITLIDPRLSTFPLFSLENNSIKEDLSLKAVRQAQSYRSNRKQSQPKSAQSETFCRVCMIARLPREIYQSHNHGDDKCTSLSVKIATICPFFGTLLGSYFRDATHTYHTHLFITHISKAYNNGLLLGAKYINESTRLALSDLSLPYLHFFHPT